jgi:hypothetical protein
MEIKRNFVKVELGSRGEVENVELVKSSYSLISKEYEDKYKELSEDEDELEYLEEFGNCSIDLDKGEVMYGFSEEDCTFYVEYNMNKIECEILLSKWKEDNLDVEFYEVIGSLGC